jgi:hypothetical protein
MGIPFDKVLRGEDGSVKKTVIMTRSIVRGDLTDGAGANIRKILGLDISASDDDVYLAIEKQKSAAAKAVTMAKIVKSADTREVAKSAQENTLAKSATTPSPAVQAAIGQDPMSYIKKGAASAFESYKQTVSASARAELQRMQKSRGVLEPYVSPHGDKPDVVASINPGTITGSAAYNVDDALSKLREMAAARRALKPTLTREQAFAEVYNENPELAERERQQRNR